MFEPIGSLLRSLTGAATGAARAAEEDVQRHNPLAAEEAKLHDAVEALHRAAESLERHVEVVETLAASVPPLATSIPPLTESVTRLTDELSGLLHVLRPVAAAEREMSRIGRVFGRRSPAEENPPAGA